MAIYNQHTNTYKVFNADNTFTTYTPKQYEEKFGATPEPVEDVTDVTEEEVGTENILAGEYVNILVTEENIQEINENLPEGETPKVLGESAILKPEHPVAAKVIEEIEEAKQAKQGIATLVPEEPAANQIGLNSLNPFKKN